MRRMETIESSKIHDFQVTLSNGETLDLAKFQGKKFLFVNTASECGYTPQLAQMEELQQAFKDRLVVIGFPCNQFGNQEPGSDTAIANFCETQFGTSFPLVQKTDVIGENRHEIYRWLNEQALEKNLNAEIEWNFYKFLVDENGTLINVFPPSVTPVSEEMLAAIEC